MGNFYTNISLKGPNQGEVVGYLNGIHRRTFVSPTVNDVTVVFDEESDSQDTEILGKSAAELSKHFDCVALAVLNHDDDILWYQLHQSGELTDEYNSDPNYFVGGHSDPSGGDAVKLCSAFGTEQGSETKMAEILRGQYVFAIERHQELVNALGISQLAVGVGYNYMVSGDMDDDVVPGSSQCVRTGD
jgi:hypothetical protein